MPTTTVEKVKKNKTSRDKKSELLLDSLEIKGYRCFEHLTIEKLGRVNLIVGKNNVGKTALLEALLLLVSNQGRYNQILGLYEILERRDEVSKEEPSSHEDGIAIRNIVFNRPDFEKEVLKKEIRIGNGNYLSITLTSNANFEPPSQEKEVSFSSTQTRFPFGFISASGFSNNELLNFWEIVERNVEEDKVVEAINIINKEVVDIRFSRHTFTNASASPIPIVRLKNAKERIPLKSLGEGMNRLLGIALALVNCKDGILLIDEIEIGLHYSVLLDIWRLIFKTARDLNVQVFATTHSSDCIKAFQRAAEEDKEDEGMLIRLVRKGDKIKAVLFDEEELETVVENNIEVR
jgi:AAA15 family ATPase/GTPase